MRHLALVVLVALPSCKCNAERNGAEELLRFKRLDEIPTFELELSKKARAALSAGERTWAKARFTYRGKTLRKVGVRLKGNRSRRKLSGKPALKIRFDRYKKKQTFLGLRRLTLNNMVEDPTRLREILGYRLYRELGVPAPAAFYANVVIDGEPYGLYAVIQTIDQDFLDERFADSSGSLYEGDYGCDLYIDDVDGFDRDSGKKGSRDDLRALAAAADGPAEALFARVEMPSFLAFLAVSAFIGDFDGYRHAHNYRLYHQPDIDKWFFIPWGIDRAFRKRLSIFESYGRLAVRCFADAKCRADYVRVQTEVLEAFAKLSLEEGAKALSSFIAEAHDTDPKRPKASRTNKARAQLLKFLRERPGEIAAEIRCIDGSGAEVDSDGDGFGCLDCNDSDASIHPGASETCDGIDNDCSGQVDDDAACPICTDVAGAPGYKLCDLPRRFAEAEKFCRSMSGQLARIDDDAIATAIAQAAGKVENGRWWIGLDDRAVEGTFTWPDGTPPAFTRWHKSEPDNHTCNQDCAVIDTERGGNWHDTHCGQPLPFVCRVSVAPSSGE